MVAHKIQINILLQWLKSQHLEQERAKAPKERFYVWRSSYSLRILSKPYPEIYEPRTFVDGRRGSTVEHVSKFIDTLGPYATDEDLCLREFSKSLCDRAYTWYTSLKPESIPTWDDIVDVFCTKYFHREETVTLATLQGTKQKNGEDLMGKIKAFCNVRIPIKTFVLISVVFFTNFKS